MNYILKPKEVKNNKPKLYDNFKDFETGAEWAELEIKSIIEDIIFFSEDELSDGECLDQIISKLKLEPNDD